MKFGKQLFKDVAKSGIGLSTGKNEQYLRYWWEVERSSFIFNSDEINSWIFIAKGGAFSKWKGNLWLVINVEDKHKLNIYNNPNAALRNKNDYYKQGVFYNRASSKGVATRLLPEGCVFESSVVVILPKNKKLTNYILGYTKIGRASCRERV